MSASSTLSWVQSRRCQVAKGWAVVRAIRASSSGARWDPREATGLVGHQGSGAGSTVAGQCRDLTGLRCVVGHPATMPGERQVTRWRPIPGSPCRVRYRCESGKPSADSAQPTMITAACRSPAASTWSAMSARVPRSSELGRLADARADDDGTVRPVVRGQLGGEAPGVPDGQVQHERGPGGREPRQRLALGHRRGVALGAGQDHRLAHLGHGELAAHQGGRGGIRGDAGGDVPRDARVVEAAGLLRDSGVHRGVSGAQPCDVLALAGGPDQGRDDLVEVEVLGVDELGARRAVREHLVVEVGPGIEADLRLLEQAHGPQGEQVGRAGAGPDEVDGHRGPSFTVGPLFGARPLDDRAGRRPGQVGAERLGALDGEAAQLAAVLAERRHGQRLGLEGDGVDHQATVRSQAPPRLRR